MSGNVVFGIEGMGDILILFFKAQVQGRKRLQGWSGIHIHSHSAKAAEAADDVARDVMAANSAREPGPETIFQLAFAQLAQSAVGFFLKAIALEKEPKLSARFALAKSVPHPRSLLDHDPFDVLVLEEWAFKR